MFKFSVDDDNPNPDLFKNNWFPNDRKILGMPEPTDDDYFVKVDIGDGDNYEPTVTDAKQYGCTDPDNINYEQFKGSQDQCPKTSSTFTGEYDYTYQCPHSHCDTEIEIFKDNSGISQTSTITGLGYAASSADAESRLESYPPGSKGATRQMRALCNSNETALTQQQCEASDRLIGGNLREVPTFKTPLKSV